MSKQNFGLVSNAKEQLVKRFLARRDSQPEAAANSLRSTPKFAQVSEKFCRFYKFSGYEKIALPQAAARKLGIENPFFKVHEGVADAMTSIGGKPYINFSSYNYLGLSGDPRVNQAAKDAIDRYGTSASASRLVAGERPIQRELEETIAGLYEVDDCVVFVSGHATNVTTIATLFGPKDLIVHDSLIHNSVFEGIKLSGATRRAFNHNNPESLERILTEIRGNFERTLIVIEGLYSMDGDFAPLAALAQVAARHDALMLVDESQATGVFGPGGRGLVGNLANRDQIITLHTCGKALGAEGALLCGPAVMRDYLVNRARGFVFSTAPSPLMAAVVRAALRLCADGDDLRAQLAAKVARAGQWLAPLGAQGLGAPIMPLVLGGDVRTMQVAARVQAAGFDVRGIRPPTVPEGTSRLRIVISRNVAEADIAGLAAALKEAL